MRKSWGLQVSLGLPVSGSFWVFASASEASARVQTQLDSSAVVPVGLEIIEWAYNLVW